jgi:hypothetical protein
LTFAYLVIFIFTDWFMLVCCFAKPFIGQYKTHKNTDILWLYAYIVKHFSSYFIFITVVASLYIRISVFLCVLYWPIKGLAKQQTSINQSVKMKKKSPRIILKKICENQWPTWTSLPPNGHHKPHCLPMANMNVCCFAKPFIGQYKTHKNTDILWLYAYIVKHFSSYFIFITVVASLYIRVN